MELSENFEREKSKQQNNKKTEKIACFVNRCFKPFVLPFGEIKSEKFLNRIMTRFLRHLATYSIGIFRCI